MEVGVLAHVQIVLEKNKMEKQTKATFLFEWKSLCDDKCDSWVTVWS